VAAVNIAVACITTDPKRRSTASEHFRIRGLQNVKWFEGIHAERIGVETKLCYELDHPGSGYKMGPMPTGCWLSHRALWAALAMTHDECTLVLEEDASLPEDWAMKLDQATRDLPEDWDMLYVGSCNTKDKPTRHWKGSVYEVKYPQCTHAILVRHRCLSKLIASQDSARCYAPIDISLALHSLPLLRVYTMLPRLVDQFDTVIPP
jgi:GR25 family glycosyltransferase involved in LPS biosynthesis